VATQHEEVEGERRLQMRHTVSLRAGVSALSWVRRCASWAQS